MNIKRNIVISLKKRNYKGKKIMENLPIRIRISYNSRRLDILTGYSVDPENWDTSEHRVKKNTINKKKEKASTINAFLNKASYEIEEAFKEFEVVDRVPTTKELEETYLRRMQDKIPEVKVLKSSRFWEAMAEFKAAESKKNSWQYSTVQKFMTLENHIRAWKDQPRFEDFTDRGLTDFVRVLLDEEGLSNSTVQKQLGYLKWFLQWAANNKYHRTMDFKTYKPHLLTSKKKIIFLTIDEIKQLLATEIPPSRPALERVRDVFVFCCFTGLRYSDAYNLRRSDISDDHIEVTTKKTADRLNIELNNVSRAILDKYKDSIFPDNKALPVISNQKMNDFLEELFKLAGFTEEIHITTYHGGERKDTVQPKYKLLTSHAARRSFICNSLSKGIPANIVMKWTGHSSYLAMKPYIEVADEIKAKEMEKMNNLIQL